MKTLLVVVIAISSVSSFLSERTDAARSVVFQQANTLGKSAQTLKLSLVTNKRTFKRNDAITLQVNLINPDFNESVFVYGTLDWGYSASVTLHVRDGAGNRVVSRFYDDALTPPLKSGDQTLFVKLRPQHLLGTYYSSTIHELNMERPGRYRIHVQYHSPISASDVDLRPFFGRESGSIRSNVVEIQVAR